MLIEDSGLFCLLLAVSISFGLTSSDEKFGGNKLREIDSESASSEKLFNHTKALALSSCPSDCHCVEVIPTKYILVACAGKLQAIPALCPLRTRVFSYTHSLVPFNTLTSASLKPVLKVRILNLSDNNIKYIENETFHEMKNLAYLFLDHNPIISIHNKGFLSSIGPKLSLLSLKNVLPFGQKEELFWEVLFGVRTIDSKSFNRSIMLRSSSLQELRLDENRLTYLNTNALQFSGVLFTLSILGLSNNLLDQNDILSVLSIKHESCIPKYRFNNLASDSDEDLKKSKDKNEFTVDFSKNQITTISSSLIASIKRILRVETPSNQQQKQCTGINPPKCHLFLKGNPWNCSCEIEPFVDFLSNQTIKNFIKDWNILECNEPTKLIGLKIVGMKDLPKSHTECFELTRSVTQLVFIVISSFVLSVVSIMVAYLNRRKVIFYFNFVKNCGEESDRTASVRWKNNLDKYTIPSDHKGDLQQHFFVEDVALK